MQYEKRFEHDLDGYSVMLYDGKTAERAGLTIAFGSRSLGDRALQTSCTAPSSDHVAAMIGSKYYSHDVEHTGGKIKR